MYDEQVRGNKVKDYQSQGRTNLGDELRPVSWPPCITIHVGAVASLLRQVTKLGVSLEQYSGYRHFQ